MLDCAGPSPGLDSNAAAPPDTAYRCCQQSSSEAERKAVFMYLERTKRTRWSDYQVPV